VNKASEFRDFGQRGKQVVGMKRASVWSAVFLTFILLCCGALFAQDQAGSGTLRGTVTDPSGAVVTNAAVAIVTPDGKTISATTNKSGVYEIKNLAPGKYTVTANAQGFSVFVQDDVAVDPGKVNQFNISLEISVEQQKLDVQEQTTQVDVNPANNAGAIILTGKDLDALSDDPDELQNDLEALAGPSAGPNGGQLYIDGFTAGQLPPKASIREIRINQNPFSSEYDKLGYGRIEVFTKPGTDKFHGQISVLGNSSAFNSQNPFLSNEPSYYSTQYMGSVSGPISKKASFFFDFQRRDINEVSVINATILNPACVLDVPTSCDPTNAGVPFTQAIPNPFTRTNLGPRVDYQINKNNTLTMRYQFWRETEENDGIGQFALQSQGYNSQDTEHTFQISDTQIIGAKAVNETRFQYIREISNQTPLNNDTSISVAGAFSSGGSANGSSEDVTNHYELQNYTSITTGKHLVKFGVRVRGVQETNTTEQNFGGTYTFPSIEAYANTFLGLSQQASQYTQVSGGIPANAGPGTAPLAPISTSSISWVDVGLYMQDDFRIRSNLTLSYGLRFETQNEIHDHSDWAPRVAIAWGIDGNGKNAAKTVLRAGTGIFYDRFKEPGILQADRFNGINQVEYLVANPQTFTFPAQPPPNLPAATSPTIYQIDPRMHAPYIIQSAVSLERQITKSANLSVSYLNSRGVRQFLTRNINAPFNSTDPTDPAVRPFDNLNNIYQYTSEGTFKQNQLIVNGNVRVASKFSLFGYYTLNYANANTNTLKTFPSNQYDLNVDYGPAAYAQRHRVLLVGTIAAPWAIRLSPFIVAQSGLPYDVTVGQDLNGDSIFYDRPSFAVNPGAGCTSPLAVCHYNLTPAPNDPRVPINSLMGPTRFSVNLRLSKTFGFGREGGGTDSSGQGGPGGGHSHGGGPGGGGGGFGRGMGGGGIGLGSATNRRYSLTIGILARNIFNRENLATPIGNLDSPKFGESVALAGGPYSSQAANRKIELQASFSF
jgi:Carboxypeptidase regulatory-like domain